MSRKVKHIGFETQAVKNRPSEEQLIEPSGVQSIELGYKQEITPSNRPKGTKIDPYKVPYIPWGEDNLFPQSILELLGTGGSAYFARIMESYTRFIVGDGFTIEGLQPNEESIILSKLADNGIDYENLQAWAWDLALFNTMSAQVNSIMGMPVLLHERVSDIRRSRGESAFYICKDWNAIDIQGKVKTTIKGDYKKFYEPIKIIKANPNNPALGLLWASDYNPLGNQYPVSPAESCLTELKTITQISEFHYSSITNGIFAGQIIVYPKQFNADNEAERKSQESITDGIKKALAGASKAGHAMVLFQDIRSDKGVQILSAETDDNDKKYIENNRMLREQVMTGLGVIVPELFGVPSAAGFTSKADTLAMAYNLTYEMQIKPRQTILLTALQPYVEKILGRNDLSLKIKNTLFNQTGNTQTKVQTQAPAN